MRVREKNIYLTLLPLEENETSPIEYPLHALINDELSLSVMRDFVDKVGESLAETMSVTLNDDGRLPLDLMSCFDIKDYRAVEALLLSLMQRQKIKPLTEKITIDSVITGFYPVNTRTLKNYHIACGKIN